jgi:coproporphyrinogen III oxidase
LGSPFRAEHAANQFDIGKLRDLIDAEFNFIDPKWRRRRDDDGRVVGVTYNLVRTGGLFENSVVGAGDRAGEYLAAMRRAIDEYVRQCGAKS